MNNKKDIKQQVRSDLTMLEELKKLKQDLETYKKSGIELGNEIITLKRQNAGLKGLNKQLQKRVEHYKQLDLEGDELNEKKIEKIDWLSKELKKANETAEKQSKYVNSLQEKNLALGKENTSLRTTIENYKKMPWYKKVFRHN